MANVRLRFLDGEVIEGESDDVSYPVTLGDFIRFYDHAAQSHGVDSRQPG